MKKTVKTIAIPNPRLTRFASSQRTTGLNVPATRRATTSTRRTGQSWIRSHREAPTRTSATIVLGDSSKRTRRAPSPPTAAANRGAGGVARGTCDPDPEVLVGFSFIGPSGLFPAFSAQSSCHRPAGQPGPPLLHVSGTIQAAGTLSRSLHQSEPGKP